MLKKFRFVLLSVLLLIPAAPASAHEPVFPAELVDKWETYYNTKYPSYPLRDRECAAMREVVFEQSGWRWPSDWRLYCHVTLGSDSTGERRCVTSRWYKYVACDWKKISTMYGPDYKPLLQYLMAHEILGHAWAAENCSDLACGTGDVECFADRRAHEVNDADLSVSRYQTRCGADWPH